MSNTSLDLNKDGNQQEPECSSCNYYGPGPCGKDYDLTKHLCCHHGAYRGSYKSGNRTVILFRAEEKAPPWCPRKLRNSQCTCGECSECICKKKIDS